MRGKTIALKAKQGLQGIISLGAVLVFLAQPVLADSDSPQAKPFVLMLQANSAKKPVQTSPADQIELRDNPGTSSVAPAVGNSLAPDDLSFQPISLRGVDTPDTLSVGIQRLVGLIEDSNLDMAIANTHVDQAHWYMIQAFSQLLPSLQSSNYAEHFYGNDVLIDGSTTPVNRDVNQFRVIGSYDIQLGGKDLFVLKSSKMDLKRLKNTYDLTEQQALLNILNQYYQYLRDIAVIEVAEEALRQANIQLRLSESRYHAGFTTKLDVSQAQTLVAEKEGQLVQAKSQKAATQYALASSINLPIDMRIEPEEPDLRPVRLVDDQKTIPQLLEIAIKNRSDLKSLSDSIESAKANYSASRANMMPTLSLGTYQRSTGQNLQKLKGSTDFTATVNISLLNNLGLNVWSDIQQNKSKIKEAQLTLQKQLFDTQRSLSEAYLNCDLSYKEIDISRQKVQSALEGFEVARRRRASGLGINLDVVQAQKDLSDARQEFYTAIMNYNNYELRLLFEIGQLTPSNLMAAIQNPALNPRGNSQQPVPQISSSTAH